MPHDGTALSVLAAMRRHLDGFNPDRAQIEKGRHRPAIVAALERARAQDDAQFYQAAQLFPEVSLPPVSMRQEPQYGLEREAIIARVLAWQEPQFPLCMPNVAPSARGARGTPVSDLLPPASPFGWPCNRGLTLFPASMTPRASLVALDFGMRGNSAPAL